MSSAIQKLLDDKLDLQELIKLKLCLNSNLLSNITGDEPVQLRNNIINYLNNVDFFKNYTTDCITRSNITLRPNQLQAVKMINNQRSLLIIFDTGVGKTLSALTASQCYLDSNPTHKIVVISPKSLLKNFHKEMKKYGGKIDNRYHFFSFSKFMHLDKKSKAFDCKNSMLIIDESHNIRQTGYRKDGTINHNKGIIFRSIYKCAKICNKILLLTATPMINTYKDLYSTLMLLGYDYSELPQKSKYFDEEMVKTDLVGLLNNKAIYYRKEVLGHDYPVIRKHMTEIEMSDEYYNEFNKILTDLQTFGDRPEIFYHGYRRAVNKLGGEYFSSKIDSIINKLKLGKKSLIYSNWLKFGINIIRDSLISNNIKFRIIEGSTPSKIRNSIVRKYNRGDFNVLLITKAGAEGLDLIGVREVFILDPVWNPAGLHQIVGRAVRYKSHANLPESERFVDVYYLVLVYPAKYGRSNYSGDVILYNIIESKKIEQDKLYSQISQSCGVISDNS